MLLGGEMCKVVVVDTEGNGLAQEQADETKAKATVFHIMGYTYDGKTVETTTGDTQMCNLLYKWEREGYKIVMHNAMRHDVSLFRDLLGVDLPASTYVDTLALSWTLNHDRSNHGLGSYGEDFGVPKPDVEFWERQEGQTEEEFLEIMRERVSVDVLINWKLWKQLEGKLGELYGTIN